MGKLPIPKFFIDNTKVYQYQLNKKKKVGLTNRAQNGTERSAYLPTIGNLTKNKFNVIPSCKYGLYRNHLIFCNFWYSY